MQNIRDTELLAEFLVNFPNSVHIEEAKTRITCVTFDKRLMAKFKETKQDSVGSALAAIREIDKQRPEQCKNKSHFFSGKITTIFPCYNRAIYVQLDTLGTQGFVWTYSTDAKPGPPQGKGQWIFGTTGAPYYCIKEISPLRIWPAQSIDAMRRLD